ncbi:MAG TPA: type I-C CRISPR-associated protein Cas5 [Bacillus sp. (in: Bacteria)]|uniref:pre-crRNA processing endonuclease n=1 Tax=Anoxybacillus andreesenii TaxID=1325932 RepID=A0ABT9V9A9_9BACL|nr:type I-C CRISPR-associated protein Cas5c [Robertmurraya andreesenii]MDQ0157555.1 CRISPR-associated protein Cas5d [Robertmurraya andreesenii]HCX48643.1 type I-C CRISPR-associated protein Cas5 [Bacillus sp. (in: firmicutes)]
MGYGIRMRVWGDFACFTRPEMKVERVSYDVITPSAARGILESIHWKPAIRWVVDKITVVKPIKFDNIRRNEVKDKMSVSASMIEKAMNEGKAIYLDSNDNRAQRATMLLKNVEYIIEAHFELTEKAGETDTVEKHYNIVLRRLRKGQCFSRPYLGCREFSANFEIVEEERKIDSHYQSTEIDLGWMLWDIDFDRNCKSIFYRPKMVNGEIEVPNLWR